MKKRILSLALSLSLLLSIFTTFPYSVSAISKYENFSYTVSNGKIEITDCDNTVQTVVIPDKINGYPVTAIYKYAFNYCESLTNITIGNNVSTIDENAFSDCTSLTNINVLEDNQYYSSTDGVLFNKNKTILITYPDGKNNTAYTIPRSVTTIGNYAFSDCTSLTSISIPENVTAIGNRAFLYCYNLANITLTNSVTTIGDYAFYDCTGLTNITIPDSVTTIGNYVFYGCESLTNITLGNNLTTIGNSAFRYCDSLTSITIPDSVTSIGSATFRGCESLTSITIPDSVTSIGHHAFERCESLTSIIIPDSVTTIGDYAFDHCRSLTNITIPDSVTTIGNYAFRYCDSLTSITIPYSVTTIGNYTFDCCYNLANIALTNSVTTIGDYAFYRCRSLTSITIPDSVTVIGESAFWGCLNLTNITLGNGITQINIDAFAYCKNLKDVYYKGTSNNWKKVKIASGNDPLYSATFHSNDPQIDVSYVSMISPSATIKVGDTYQAMAYCIPKNATDKKLTWSTNNPLAVEVNDNGVVTAKGPGKATITATSNNRKSASCIVTVDTNTDYENFKYQFRNNAIGFGYKYKIDGTKIITSYSIPKERYLEAGYDEPTAKELFNKEKKEGWGGNCFGMSLTSILFYKEILEEKNYQPTATYPHDFYRNTVVIGIHEYPAVFQNDLITKLIELFQVAQFENITCNIRDFSKNEIANQIDDGNPVRLSLKNKGSGHSVVIYDYSKDNGKFTFDIYDSSGFVDQLVYTEKKDYYFKTRGFNYIPDESNPDWKINGYSSYQDILELHNQISQNSSYLFSSDPNSYIYIIVDVQDLTLTNSQGQITTITNAEATGDISDIRVIPGSYLAEKPTYTIILPTDTYTIVGNGEDVITTSFADDYMSASVTAKSNTPITISSDLKEISVDTVTGEEYDITYTTYDNVFDEMNLSGTATGTVTTKLNDTDVLISGVDTLTTSASVSDSVVSANLDSLSNSDEITVKCEDADSGATLQILSTDAELTERTVLPERLQVEAPVYDLESGVYTEGQMLNFTKDDETVIYYTTDGSIPSADNGIIYSLPVDINKSMTIKAISTKYGYSDSEIVELSYILPEVDMPQADVESGEYNEVITVELSTGNYEDTIYYTLDGSSPLENGILYTVPINISEDTYLQAYTLRNGCISEISEYEYTVAPTHPFYFSNSLTNQDGDIITPDNIADVTKVKMTLSQLHTGEHTGIFLIAFYDADNRLVYANYKAATVSKETEEVEIDITESVSSAYKVKAFAWKDLSTMQPICKSLAESIIMSI